MDNPVTAPNLVFLNKSKKFLGLALGLNLVGWLNALYALWHRQGLFANGLIEKSFCHVSDFIDCDSVAFSKYSSFLGMPTANWGMMFYALSILLIMAAYFAAQDHKKESLLANLNFLFVFNLANIVGTFIFASISLFKLHTLCLVCLATYLINVASLYVIFRARAAALEDPESRELSVPTLSILTPFVGGLGALLLALHLLAPSMVTNIVGKVPMDDSTVSMVMQKFLTEQPMAFSLVNGPTYGTEGAPIVVVEFSDFQCPYCGISAKTMPSFLKAYEGKVKYLYKYYPLDSSCNSKMERAVHHLACTAAKTAQCVFKAKGSEAFFKFKEETFLHQQDMSPESLINTAKSLGIEEAALKTCVEDPATHQAIVDNVNEGIAAKVEGTPAIFVNGRMVETGPNPQVLTKVFDEVLKSLKQ